MSRSYLTPVIGQVSLLKGTSLLLISLTCTAMADVGPAPSQQQQDLPPTTALPPQPTTTNMDRSVAPASLTDNGLSRRPRDARLIHMVLANLGITSYQERVPLQLMDFAYRYTSSTLQDALHLTSEGYGTAAPGTGRGAAATNDLSSITLAGLKLSIASRTQYQYDPTLPKEFHHEVAAERNKVALPAVGRDWGLRLPAEQFCLTGVGWGLKEEWDTDGETESEEKGDEMAVDEHREDEEGIEDEDGNERMEDVFGEDVDGGDGSKDMEHG